MNNVIDKKVKALDKTSVEIGVRITARGKQLGLTQEMASEAADISLRFFACVERGTKNMRARNVIKVANTLGISTNYILLGITDEMDDSKLSEMLEPLSQEKRYHLEEITRHYVQVYGYYVQVKKQRVVR